MREKAVRQQRILPLYVRGRMREFFLQSFHNIVKITWRCRMGV
ncbi:hypothetical protein HMPREF1548_03269 [Clostridium sp. KLE 1755]|nr:hypothetical protein HMPREF1548_03269 [Clostridium sp. KLE 1755]